MSEILYFVGCVLISGWVAGWVLAKDLKKNQRLTTVGVLVSFIAVALPTLLTFYFASASERSELFGQFRAFQYAYLIVALVVPFIVVSTGHLIGSSRDPSILAFPRLSSWKKGLTLLPLVFLWSLLEEIGWRGYLVPKLLNYTSLPVALFLSGLLWGVWHAPQMFLNPQLNKKVQGRVLLGACLWSIQCVLLGSLLGLMQIKSGTFLVPTIAHALINFLGSVSEQELGDSQNAIFVGTSGLAAIIASASLLAIWTLA